VIGYWDLFVIWCLEFGILIFLIAPDSSAKEIHLDFLLLGELCLAPLSFE
jgi:hypothetical protein